MHSATILAWACDGELVCPDCYLSGIPFEPLPGCFSDSDSPVFADEALESFVGYACFSCQRFLAPDGSWEPDPGAFRWSTCGACNHKRPWSSSEHDYRDARLEALKGKLRCSSCGKPEVHF